MSLAANGTLTVTMVSDWRVGTGAGHPGVTNSAVRRDADGLSFVPAKTLTGVWRDAAQTVARALGETWPDAVELLFGSKPSRQNGPGPVRAPVPAALSVRAARLTPDLRERLAGGKGGRQRLRDALTFVKPAVEIDEGSGRAKDDHLRLDELARRGATLRADFAVDMSRLGDVGQHALALLYAAATFVERLGADRRRGTGRASLTVDAVKRSEIVELLSVTPAPAFEVPEAPPDAIDDAVSLDEPWRRIRLGFTLDAPVLAGATAAGNVVRSLDFVPGANVLAAVSARLDRAAVAGALQAGDLLVTPATLGVEGDRGRPVPLCLDQRKDALGHQINRFTASRQDAEVQTKQLRSGYLGAGDRPLLASVETSVTTHGTIDEETQRPTTEIGGVFSYAVIAAGQRLVAELRVRGDRLGASTAIAAALDGTAVRLGRSKKDDYGAATIDASVLPSDEPPDPRTCADATVWLLSDVVARDEALRPAPTVQGLLDTLTRALKTSGDLDVEVTLAETEPNAYLRTRRAESWHTGWQLPRETIVAVQAGSCAKLRFEPPVPRAALTELELSGIGGRRGEGYGQVVFDDPLLDAVASASPDDEQPKPDPEPSPNDGLEPTPILLDAGHPETTFAEQIEDAAWRTEIARLAALTAADDVKRYTALGLDPHVPHKPRTAQLSALRNAALRLDDEPGALRSWLNGVCARPARRDLWPGGSLAAAEAEDAADGAVRRLCTQEGYVWTVLDDASGLLAAESPMCLARKPSQLREALGAWALQALIDACVRAIVRERERGDDVS